VKKQPEAELGEERLTGAEMQQVAEEALEAAVERVSAAEAPPREEGEALRRPKKKVKKVEAARIIELPPKPAPAEAPPRPHIAEPRKEAPEFAERSSAEPVARMAAEAAAERPAAPAPEEKRLEMVVREGEAVSAPAVRPAQPGVEAPAAPEEEAKAGEERPAKKKKKKEKRMQPAQIIGKVDLRKEPVREPEKPEEAAPAPPPRPVRTTRPARPASETGITTYIPEPVMSEEEKRKKKKKDKKAKDAVEEKADLEKQSVRRRKEVVLGADLYDDRPRGRRGKGRKPRPLKTAITTPKAIKRRLKLPEVVTVASLAHKMSVKAADVIQHLIVLGVTSSMNEPVDFDTATIVAAEFGFEVESSEQQERDLLPLEIKDTEENLLPRPPVITVMGHVDHGKTSLLDAIRSTHVTDQEAGGITQHIGASKVKLPKGDLVFLDTPGHEAFTAMRARGAHVTDFVVLVVAADDGVMEQTKEAINHARAANVPIIVAVNKIDKPEADKDRVLRELSEQGLIPEDWGGDTLFTYVSAKTGQGIEEFLETILLQSEMMELRSNPNKKAIATVIEARLDKGKGPLATILVKEGTLRLGDAFVAGTHHGKVRAMLDYEGRAVTEATPANPVEVQGFSGVPEAGDAFIVVEEEKIARQIGMHRLDKIREHGAAATGAPSLEDLLARMQDQEIKEINLIVKADVQGSVEAVKEALLGLTAHEVKVKIIHSGVGTITESDIMLASASRAIIVGFNVRPTPKTMQLAEQEKVDVRLYSVIYEALEDIRKAMVGMLEPIEKETVVGRAEVRQTFHLGRVGNVAGCYVTSGKIERSNQVRLIRDDVAIYQGRITSMKRYKDDIKEALEGYECGLVLENYRDIKVGDVIEAFIIEREIATLT